jgi:hypothetical protein
MLVAGMMAAMMATPHFAEAKYAEQIQNLGDNPDVIAFVEKVMTARLATVPAEDQELYIARVNAAFNNDEETLDMLMETNKKRAKYVDRAEKDTKDFKEYKDLKNTNAEKKKQLAELKNTNTELKKQLQSKLAEV